MIAVTTAVAALPADGSPAVLLQLPYGYVILRPSDSRKLAAELLNRADEADGVT